MLTVAQSAVTSTAFGGAILHLFWSKVVDRGQRRGTVAGKAGWLFGALEQAALASSGTRGAVSLVHDDGPDEPRAGMYLLTLQVTPTLPP